MTSDFRQCIYVFTGLPDYRAEVGTICRLEDTIRFALYPNLALETGESFSICMCTCFDEKLPKSFKEYTKGHNPAHYYYKMPSALVRLLDGMRAMVVLEGVKTAKMIYNTTGWMPLDGEAMTG